MSAASSLAQAASDVETRIFRRGVSDQEVRQAIDLVAEYIATHLQGDVDEIDRWSAFSEVYEDLSRNFTPAQTAAFEIATDTVVVGFGCPRWSSIRPALREAGAAAGVHEERAKAAKNADGGSGHR